MNDNRDIIGFVFECIGMASVVACILWLVMQVARSEPYSAWITNYAVADTNAAADPDSDGIPNLMEYALDGLDPSRVDSASALPRMVYGTRATNTALPYSDASVITYAGLTPPLSSYWYLGLRYTPRAGTSGIRLRPQYCWWGANLDGWLDGRSVFLAPVADGTNGAVIQWMQGMFRPAAPPEKSFARLIVEEAPTP